MRALGRAARARSAQASGSSPGPPSSPHRPARPARRRGSDSWAPASGESHSCAPAERHHAALRSVIAEKEADARAAFADGWRAAEQEAQQLGLASGIGGGGGGGDGPATPDPASRTPGVEAYRRSGLQLASSHASPAASGVVSPEVSAFLSEAYSWKGQGSSDSPDGGRRDGNASGEEEPLPNGLSQPNDSAEPRPAASSAACRSLGVSSSASVQGAPSAGALAEQLRASLTRRADALTSELLAAQAQPRPEGAGGSGGCASQGSSGSSSDGDEDPADFLLARRTEQEQQPEP